MGRQYLWCNDRSGRLERGGDGHCGGLLSHRGLEERWHGGGVGTQHLWCNECSGRLDQCDGHCGGMVAHRGLEERWHGDRKSTRLNSSHANISYAVFCLKK